MPERPDYALLIQGQIAVLDRIDAGEIGLSVLTQIVQLAQDALAGLGAAFAEYAPTDARVITATGVCARTLGRRLAHDDPTGPRTRLIPSGDAYQVLATRCAAVGSLYVHLDAADPAPGPDSRAVLELVGALIGRLYAQPGGLTPRAAEPAEQTRRQENRDLWVAVTSHELRTPVTVIKGYADTLTNHWDSLGEQGRREAVRVIGARAGELARLVDRLLSATSEDGEVGGSPPGPFDLVDALRRAVDELPADLRPRLLLDELPADLPKAYGDRDSLATILTELATNAEKYSTPDTAVELTAEADTDTVTFRVSDRGIGIAPEDAERAFERYWQGDTGDRRHHPGAGLGLYLVRRLVERQHGWVSLRPRDGGGTVVDVRLPRG